jgi:hypothetical protein
MEKRNSVMEIGRPMGALTRGGDRCAAGRDCNLRLGATPLSLIAWITSPDPHLHLRLFYPPVAGLYGFLA